MGAMIEEFARVQAKRGRGLFLRSADKTLVGLGGAQEAVEWLRARGVVILGFEGFRTDGVSLVPLLDYIADFSTIEGAPEEQVARSADAALIVLEKWKSGAEFIEFVVDDAAATGPRRLWLDEGGPG